MAGDFVFTGYSGGGTIYSVSTEMTILNVVKSKY